jgi:hypothetical protein
MIEKIDTRHWEKASGNWLLVASSQLPEAKSQFYYHLTI